MKPMIPMPIVAICNRSLGEIALTVLFSRAFCCWSSTMAGSELAVSADNAANFLRKVRLVLRLDLDNIHHEFFNYICWLAQP